MEEKFKERVKDISTLVYDVYEGPPPGAIRDSITSHEYLFNSDLITEDVNVVLGDFYMLKWASGPTEYLNCEELIRYVNSDLYRYLV